MTFEKINVKLNLRFACEDTRFAQTKSARNEVTWYRTICTGEDMRLIIAGSRHLSLDVEGIQAFINYLGIENITEVVCGKAKGIDTSGELWAKANGIPVQPFPAEWDQYGKAAGHIRNKAMAEYGDELLIIWNQKSRGSANMIQNMDKLGKPVHEGTF